MTSINSIQSNTPQDYLFRIESNIGNLNLTHPPLEWKDASYNIERDIKSGGVFDVFQVESLTFIKEGANLLRQNFEQDEIEATATLIVKWFNQKTRQYTEFPTAYKFDFKTYRDGKVSDTDLSIGVNINVEKSTLKTLIDNRKDVDVDLTRLVTLGGFTVDDYTDSKLFGMRLPQISAYLSAEWTDEGNSPVGLTETIIDLETLNYSDFTEAETVLGAAPTINKYFFLNSEDDRTLLLSGDFNYSIEITAYVGNFTFDLIVEVFNSSDVLQSQTTLYTNTTYASTQKTYTINGTFSDKSIAILATENLRLVAKFTATGLTTGTKQVKEFTTFEVVEERVETPLTYIGCFPVYEAFERNCQMIADKQFPFYSEKFGRDDAAYNAAGDFYLSEDQLTFANVTSGLSIRGLSLSSENNPIVSNFTSLFKTFQSMYNIGWGIETIEGEERIRIEDYEYFFDDTEILDFSDQLKKWDITKEVDPSFCYLEMNSGYENFDYESINGRGEYNTLNKRTSEISTEEEFNNISPYRADTFGISKLVTNQISENGTTDEKEDNDTFIIKAQRGTPIPTIEWSAEIQENITIVDNTSLFRTGSLNLYFTPSRNLIRNAQRWKVGLTKMPSSSLRFQVAGKLQTLKTTGEGYTITENDDIIVSDTHIDDPLFRPILHTAEVVIDWTDINTIKNNPYKLIRLSTDVVGWLVSLSKKNTENKATITIIEKYVS